MELENNYEKHEVPTGPHLNKASNSIVQTLKKKNCKSLYACSHDTSTFQQKAKGSCKKLYTFSLAKKHLPIQKKFVFSFTSWTHTSIYDTFQILSIYILLYKFIA
jgi:hypothetical protein